MTDPRLERLRQLDTAATPAPWVLWDKQAAGYVVVGDTGQEPAAGVYTEADAEWITTARRMLPATIELLELVLDGYIAGTTPKPLLLAALAVLDSIGEQP